MVSVLNCVTHIYDIIPSGKAASIAEMCITPSEFEVRLGDFGQYCPVSLANKGELVDCAVQRKLTHAAEFRGKAPLNEITEQHCQLFIVHWSEYHAYANSCRSHLLRLFENRRKFTKKFGFITVGFIPSLFIVSSHLCI